MVKIYLDPGHGGKDPGAMGNGLKEKDIVLDICKRINNGLQAYENVDVIMSRSTDVFIPLEDRTRQANNANCDLLLSVHINSALATTARGFETFTYPNSGSATTALQNVLHAEILRAMGSGITDRGKKTKNLHMLRESKMKALLSENLFISNPSDAKLLADAEFRQKIANGHIIGLERFLGLKKPAQPPPTTPPTTGKLWTVQVGAFEEKTNAEAMANDLKKQGYRPFIKYE